MHAFMISVSNFGFYSNQVSGLEGSEPRSLNWIILSFAILCIALKVYYGIYLLNGTDGVYMTDSCARMITMTVSHESTANLEGDSLFM